MKTQNITPFNLLTGIINDMVKEEMVEELVDKTIDMDQEKLKKVLEYIKNLKKD